MKFNIQAYTTHKQHALNHVWWKGDGWTDDYKEAWSFSACGAAEVLELLLKNVEYLNVQGIYGLVLYPTEAPFYNPTHPRRSDTIAQ